MSNDILRHRLGLRIGIYRNDMIARKNSKPRKADHAADKANPQASKAIRKALLNADTGHPSCHPHRAKLQSTTSVSSGSGHNCKRFRGGVNRSSSPTLAAAECQLGNVHRDQECLVCSKLLPNLPVTKKEHSRGALVTVAGAENNGEFDACHHDSSRPRRRCDYGFKCLCAIAGRPRPSQLLP